MRKIIGTVSAFVILAGLFTGCGLKNTEASGDPAQTTGHARAESAKADAGNPKRRFSRPDLSGEVTSIVGNEVTLKVIEMPQTGPNMARGAQRGMRPPGEGRPGQGFQAGAGTGMMGPGTIKYSGEKKTVLIPVGIPITTMTRGEKGRETKTLDFTDIKKGAILQIWYADQKQTAISRISVRTMARG